MNDSRRSKEELIRELNLLRKRNFELELRLSKTKKRYFPFKNPVDELQAIIDSLPAGLWIMDETGKTVFINDIAHQIWGGAPYVENVQELESYNAWWYDTGEKISPEDMPLAQALRGGRLTEVAVRFERSDGSTGIQLVSAAPFRDSRGEIYGAIAIVQDITEQKEYEEALNQSEKRFRALVMANSDIVYRMSPDWNEIYQMQNNEIIKVDDRESSWIKNLIEPESRPQIQKLINDAIHTKSNFELEHQIRNTDNNQITVLSRIIPILDTDGEIVEWVGSMRDITINKQAEELRIGKQALERTLEMKDEFLSIISHEFRTPLNVIFSAVQTIEQLCVNELSTKGKNLLFKIKQNSFRQMRLVNNLLDITRVNAGQMKMKMTNKDIVYFTRAITESVEIYASQKNISLDFSPEMESKVIATDEEHYERIVLNLLSNAIKYTPDGKSIYVRLSKEMVNGKPMVCLQVIDQGVGIPADKTASIFERFEQVDNILTRQAEGTGIGLSLVKMLVEMLGGVISLTSRVGSGSNFSVFLPDQTAKEESANSTNKLNNDRLVRSIEVEFSDIYLHA